MHANRMCMLKEVVGVLCCVVLCLFVCLFVRLFVGRRRVRKYHICFSSNDYSLQYLPPTEGTLKGSSNSSITVTSEDWKLNSVLSRDVIPWNGLSTSSIKLAALLASAGAAGCFKNPLLRRMLSCWPMQGELLCERWLTRIHDEFSRIVFYLSSSTLGKEEKMCRKSSKK